MPNGLTNAPASLQQGIAQRLGKRRLVENFDHVAVANRSDGLAILVGDLDPSPDSLTRAELDALTRCGIEWKGHLADVRPAIAECSVYVLPSYREGTPRSVLEAMATGRAIVTTDAPGCRETVQDGENGILVRPRDADTLFAAMQRFVDEPALAAKMGAASRKLAESKYDVRKVNATLLRHLGLS